MEKEDRLWPGGPVFYLSDQAMKPSTDSFLLAEFAAPHRGDTIVDLGAGSGILEILLLSREPTLRITGIECQPEACELARRTLSANGMSAEILHGDLRRIQDYFSLGKADMVICNPPYFSPGSGAVAVGVRGHIRSEVTASLAEVITAAEKLLKFGGSLVLVHKAERLVDLMELCRRFHLEPKRMRLVQHRPDSVPSLVLLSCRKGGHPGLQVEPPLWMQDGQGQETEPVKRAYFRDKE